MHQIIALVIFHRGGVVGLHIITALPDSVVILTCWLYLMVCSKILPIFFFEVINVCINHIIPMQYLYII